MNERKLFQNGITLIALVISIIVMLILAGVSLNATIGNNGIITQAQNATYMQDCAKLEEFLQSYYVSHFDTLPTVIPFSPSTVIPISCKAFVIISFIAESLFIEFTGILGSMSLTSKLPNTVDEFS